MSTTIVGTTTLVTEHCYKCGVVFAWPLEIQARRRFDGLALWCPVCGCQQYYCETEKQKLEAAVARERQLRDQAEAEAREQRERTNAMCRTATALRGVVTRNKNRISKGVCPCCNRHFTNLERHMKGQHPDYATSES